MGYLYILSNPSMPGLLKIGFTDRTPDDRISELSGVTGIPTPFQLEFAVHVRDHVAGERSVHQRFEEHRVSGSREFFRVTLEAAKDALIAERHTQAVGELMVWDEESRKDLVKALLRVWDEESRIDLVTDIIRDTRWDEESRKDLVTDLLRDSRLDARTIREFVDAILLGSKHLLAAIPPDQHLPNIEKAAVLAWNDERLMDLVDSIFLARPIVRREFK